jgi:hypothetical protein
MTKTAKIHDLTNAQTGHSEKLDALGLTRLSAQPGPCVTLLVPAHHPGAPDGSQRVRRHGLLKNIQASGGAGKVLEGLLKRAGEFASTLPDTGGPGTAIYCTPTFQASVLCSGTTEKAVVASNPYVIPLLEDALSSHDLFVLCLSTKQLKLYEYAGGTSALVPLPAAVPVSLEAAGHFHTGTTHGETRTSAGHSAGKMTALRFGTSGSRESARGEVEHFFSLVDSGLKAVIGERPLLLTGVREEIAAYRRVSHCDSLLHSEVDGNNDFLTAAQITELAKNAALEEYRRHGSEILQEFREMRDRNRTASSVGQIIRAAGEGRVHRLCVRTGTELPGKIEGGSNNAGLAAEDLANAAVVRTLANGGEVYLLPADQMSETEPLCAILRY